MVALWWFQRDDSDMKVLQFFFFFLSSYSCCNVVVHLLPAMFILGYFPSFCSWFGVVICQINIIFYYKETVFLEDTNLILKKFSLVSMGKKR